MGVVSGVLPFGRLRRVRMVKGALGSCSGAREWGGVRGTLGIFVFNVSLRMFSKGGKKGDWSYA